MDSTQNSKMCEMLQKLAKNNLLQTSAAFVYTSASPHSLLDLLVSFGTC